MIIVFVEFCARIAAKEKLKNRPAGLTSSSSSDDDGKKTDDDELIHHPFKVTEKAITMNIRVSIYYRVRVRVLNNISVIL